MTSHKDPPNIADIAASHIDHLNRIPGILVPENGWPISIPGRQLLSSKLIFGENNTLSYRQRANGTIIIQCVDFFAEFLPRHKSNTPASPDDVEYDKAFWTLIKDMLPYDEPKLTRNVYKHIYDLLRDARSRYKLAHPLRELRDIAKDEKYFLTCLDEHEAHCHHGFSEAQLKYGQRRDEDFAVRLATRVNQWRHLTRSNTKNFRILLFMQPVLTMDVTPVDEWNEKFFEDATDFAIRFQKPAPQIPTATDSPKSKDTRDLSMVRRMRQQMATMTGLINKVEAHVTEINKNVIDIQHDVVGIKGDVKELRESNNAISKVVNNVKAHLVDGYKKVVGKDWDRKGTASGIVPNKRPRTAE